MKIMLFLILVSLLLAAGFLVAFLRAARAGQFDDEYTPAIRILFDHPPTTRDSSSEQENSEVNNKSNM
jgi:cbb3-type cytochrome oxidase maturation protein